MAAVTAATLIAAATARDIDQKRAVLLVGLRRDPAFALWSVSHAWLETHFSIEHLHALATWLTKQDLSRLLCPARESRGVEASEPVPEETRASADWPAFHQLGCRGVAIANRIVTEAATADPTLDPHGDPRVLRALLVDASAWLAVAATPSTPVATQHMTDWLPKALAESIRRWTPSYESAEDGANQCECESAWSCEEDLDTTAQASSARQLIRPVLAQARQLHQLEVDFERELEQAKLHAMKELAYGASHEINNPLANISTRAQTLLREEHDPERRRALANINRQAFRAHEMIADLMLFANPPRLQRRATNLGNVVREVLDELRVMAEERGVRLVRSGQDGDNVWGDPVQLAVAIKALCQNAIEAMPHSGTLEVRWVPAEGRPPMTVITVSDSGSGLSEEVHKHLFEPFFSGREAGRGLGFGLSKAWRIITDHDGRIEVDSQAGEGTVVTLRLPAVDVVS